MFAILGIKSSQVDLSYAFANDEFVERARALLARYQREMEALVACQSAASGQKSLHTSAPCATYPTDPFLSTSRPHLQHPCAPPDSGPPVEPLLDTRSTPSRHPGAHMEAHHNSRSRQTSLDTSVASTKETASIAETCSDTERRCSYTTCASEPPSMVPARLSAVDAFGHLDGVDAVDALASGLEFGLELSQMEQPGPGDAAPTATLYSSTCLSSDFPQPSTGDSLHAPGLSAQNALEYSAQNGPREPDPPQNPASVRAKNSNNLALSVASESAQNGPIDATHWRHSCPMPVNADNLLCKGSRASLSCSPPASSSDNRDSDERLITSTSGESSVLVEFLSIDDYMLLSTIFL